MGARLLVFACCRVVGHPSLCDRLWVGCVLLVPVFSFRLVLGVWLVVWWLAGDLVVTRWLAVPVCFVVVGLS